MFIVLVVIHVVVCVTLIAVILLQAGKGHGLAGSSFGSEMNTVFGTQTASFMTKATTAAAIVFILTCLGIDVYIASQGKSLLNAQEEQMTQEQLQTMLEKIQAEQGEGDAAAEAVVEKSAEAVDAEAGVGA